MAASGAACCATARRSMESASAAFSASPAANPSACRRPTPGNSSHSDGSKGSRRGRSLEIPAREASLPFPAPPPPVYAFAIMAKDRKDDVKLSGALHKLVLEDPALCVEHDLETGETLLKGQGEIHLNTAIERLATIYNLQITTASPKIAFKETIKRKVLQHSRLKRQTGGHGQFADVKLEIEPRGRGEGFLFIDKIVGGAVPRQYIPAVGEAAEEAMQKGPFGYPVVDVAVTLVDGMFHSVDSSDMAFRTATRMGIIEGLAKADPVLLEPIEHVTASVPNIFTAATQRLLIRPPGSDSRLCRAARLARLGRCRGARAGRGTA